MRIKKDFLPINLIGVTTMKKFEIIDLIEELGFPYLAAILDSNECTPQIAIEHLNRCKNESLSIEFSDSNYMAVICLLDLYFSL